MSSTFDFCALTQRRLQALVFDPLPKDEWYVTVVDKNALKVLSSHMKMSDLLDFNVSVVDPLEISRREAKNAIYIISPVLGSIRRVLEDFQTPKPLYENVRLFFTSKASEKVLNQLKSCAPLVKRLSALKEIHTEFENVDGRTFTTGSPDALAHLFGRDLTDYRQQELGKCAQRLSTIFTTLKSRPTSVTVRVPSHLPDLPNAEARRTVCKELGMMVQDKLSKWGMSDPNLFTGAGCDLIILDRGHDPVAPVIHPFHYAAITHDLVPLTDGVFKYSWMNAKGEQQSSEHMVDTTDPMWAELRHSHIAEVAEVAAARLNEFKHSRLARIEKSGAANAPLTNATASLPEYLAKKSHLSMHVELTRSIFSQIDKRDLIPLGRLEQELVFGEKKQADVLTQLKSWNTQRSQGTPTSEDIMRLLLCYFATNPGKLDVKHQESWASISHLSAEAMHTICNLQYLGVELQKQKTGRMSLSFASRKAKKALRVDRTRADSRALENGRFRPMLEETFGAFVGGRLASGAGKDFEVVESGTAEFDIPAQAPASLGAKSVRTANRPQPTWHRRAASSSSAGGAANVEEVALRSRKVVVFIVGGCTWSEVQAAHELSQEHGVEVLLGSTNMIEGGEEFLGDMARMAPYSSPDSASMEHGTHRR